MTRLAILFGGKSIEHEVSLKSAVSVLNAIDRTKYEVIMIGITKEGRWLLYDGPVDMIENGEWRDYAELKALAEPEKYNLQILTSMNTLKTIADVAFPIMHGPNGEDGKVQGVIEMTGIPCVGCSVLGSALGMEKALSKALFRQAGLPVCDWHEYCRDEIGDDIAGVIAEVEKQLPYPVFVKPAGLGASIGVSKAADREALKEALREAAELERKVLVERSINCRELEVGIIGNAVPLASAVGEVTYPGAFYDNETKMTRKAEIERIVPADIPMDLAARAKELAIEAYKTLDLRGFARVDIFLERETGELFLNEVNSIPAFADNGMFPQLWNAVGLAYSELIDRLVGYALEK